MDDHIATDLAEGVLEIRIARPEKKNALTEAMYGAMADSLVRAETASELGLVNRVFEAEDLLDGVRSIGRTLAAEPGTPVRLTKALLKGRTTELTERMAVEASHFESQLRSPEAAEAMTAFRERLKPDFSRIA